MKKILLLAIVAVVCVFADAETRPETVSRVDQIAARLPERPCTPAPRPCDRAAWAPLAKDPAAAEIIALRAFGTAAAQGRAALPYSGTGSATLRWKTSPSSRVDIVPP